MSGPGFGYPDWQGYAQWGTILTPFHSVQAVNGGSQQVFQQNLSQWQAVLIKFGPSGGSGTLTVNVSPSGGPGIPAYFNQWNLTLGGPALAVVVPTYGGQVTVSITEGTGAGTFKGNLIVVGSNVPVEKAVYAPVQNYASLSNVAIAAGATTTLTLPFIASGRLNAQVTVASAGTINDIELRWLNPDGTYSLGALLKVNAGGSNLFDLALPGQAVQLALFNTGTAAVTNVYAAMWTDTD